MSPPPGSPTRPRSTRSPFIVASGAAFTARPIFASAPVSPTARAPRAPIAATRPVLVRPASTDTTLSSAALSVTRRPSTKRGVRPRTFRSASIARPPPCTTTSGSRFARRTIAAADAATALASSSSSPPSFRTVATSVQPRRFGKSVGHVEVLNRLAGGALHQVVDARHHHELTAIGGNPPADVAEICVRDVLDLREIGTGQAHERRLLVGGLERARDPRRIDARLHARVDRFENAAIQRHEVRYERDRQPDLLFDLHAVPMAEDAIRGHAAVNLGEVRALGRRLAGPG